MKILIVGGTGLISSAVVDEAVRKGLMVTVINRGNHVQGLPKEAELIKSDISNDAYIKSVLEGRHFDAVADFICYTKAQIEHSLNLFKDFADQYIFISSACVYDTTIPGMKNEDSPKGFKDWKYSTDKWESEQSLTAMAASLGVNYTIVRPCITYDDTRIPFGVMPPYGYHWTLIERMKSGKPIVVWDGGKARWNMMRVEDFAVGFVGLVGNRDAFGEAFNICGDDASSWTEVLDATAEAAGCSYTLFDVPFERYKEYSDRKGEIAARSYDTAIDNSKIKKIVPEFAQRISLLDGVARTLEAYKARNYEKGIDWRFDAECDYVIKKELKRTGRKIREMRIGFVNYLGRASFADRLAYQFVFRKDSMAVKLIKKIKK